MRAWIIVLKVFGYTWTTLAALAIVAGIAGVWMKDGFGAVQELMSPFNMLNWIVMLITLAPGIGALMWANNLSVERPERTRT